MIIPDEGILIYAATLTSEEQEGAVVVDESYGVYA
jgi:hypothetical protein